MYRLINCVLLYKSPTVDEIKQQHFSIKKGRFATEPGVQTLKDSIPDGFVADVAKREVAVDDYVMFNRGPVEGGWMLGRVKRVLKDGSKGTKIGCTHDIQHTQQRGRAEIWSVTLTGEMYADERNEVSMWCIVTKNRKRARGTRGSNNQGVTCTQGGGDSRKQRRSSERKTRLTINNLWVR